MVTQPKQFPADRGLAPYEAVRIIMDAMRKLPISDRSSVLATVVRRADVMNRNELSRNKPPQ